MGKVQEMNNEIINELRNEIKALKFENTQYVKALKFYANVITKHGKSTKMQPDFSTMLILIMEKRQGPFLKNIASNSYIEHRKEHPYGPKQNAAAPKASIGR